jgi:DNA-binding MarR family transcriptional regulator
VSNFVTEHTARAAWVDNWQQTQTLMLLRELTDLSRRVTPVVARRAGLSHTELTALEHLMGEPLGPGEVAQRLGVTSAAASGIVDRLAAHGHAERRPHPHDGRRTQVCVTPSGRQEVVGQLMPMFTELAELDESLTAPEREAVDRYLQGAIRALRRLL